MNNIIVLGPSGSGKSTVCDYLAKTNSDPLYISYHPLAFQKRIWEHHYGMRMGSLDTKEGKEFVPEGMTVNMGQYMVDFYHFMKDRDPYFTTRQLVQRVRSTFENNQDEFTEVKTKFAFNAIRNYVEAKAIRDLCEKFDEPYVVLQLTHRGNFLSSDDKLEEIKSLLQCSSVCKSFVEFNNSQENKKALFTLVDHLVVQPGV